MIHVVGRHHVTGPGKMHRLRVPAAALGGILIVACAAATRSSPTAPPTIVPFVAVSRPMADHDRVGGTSEFVVRGRFQGTASVRGGWIDIAVSRASVELGSTQADDWRQLQVRALLVVAGPRGRMDPRSESRPVFLARALRLPPGSGATVPTTREISDTLHFGLGVPPGTELGQAWLAFEFEWPAAIPGLAPVSKFTYAHADSAMFAQLRR
jgi:hypothetical protein